MRVRLEFRVVLAAEEKRMHGTVEFDNFHALCAVVCARKDQAGFRQGGDCLGIHLVPVPVALPDDCGNGEGGGEEGH